MNRLSNSLVKFSWLITLASLALAGVCMTYTIELFKNLRPDLEELLPTTARSVIDLAEVKSRLTSIDNLAVLIRTQNSVAGRKFQDALAHELETLPTSLISSVEYRINRELEFFKARRALYIDTSDLTQIRDFIRDRIDYEKQLYNPLNIFRASELPEPMLDFKVLQKKYDGKVGAYSRFPDGYYSTPDGTKRVILVNMPGSNVGMAGVQALKKAVVEAVERVGPSRFSPDLEISYTGGVENTIEEQAALIADLELSTLVVMGLVTFVLWFFFRTIRATLAVIFSLLIGTIWTFGASYFAVGYLNANSAFLGAIVLGNGINCGIIFLARYLEERRNGLNHPSALEIAISRTAHSTLAASLAAGLSFGSLMLTEFRGFRQFGIIGLIGMSLCWIAAYTVLPAALTLMEKIKPIMTPERKKPKRFISGSLAYLIQKFPKPLWGLSIGLTIAAGLFYSKFSPSILESDLSKLRNKVSMERGSGYLSKYVDEIFQRYLSPLVILPKTLEETDRIATLLRAKQKELGENSLIANVQTIQDFLPKDQPQKIRLIHEIQTLLPPKILLRMSESERTRVRDFFTPEATRTIEMTSLPKLILDKFTEKDGTIGKLVLIEPPLTEVTRERDPLIGFIHLLRSVTDSVAPGSPVAGGLPISADMLEAIARDGPKATLFAFLAVIVLVILLFRQFRAILLVLFALVLGVFWLGGLIFALDLKINFLNFIALPITFGIGVDYGVNIFQRYQQEGRGSILQVIKGTGGAVGLCSVTTIIGWGSLLIADNQAFVSFGRLAVLGEITTLLAALVALPAFLLVFDSGRGSGRVSGHGADIHLAPPHPENVGSNAGLPL